MSIQRFKNCTSPEGDYLIKRDDGEWMLHTDHLADKAKDLAEIERYRKALEWIYSYHTGLKGATPLEATELAMKETYK